MSSPVTSCPHSPRTSPVPASTTSRARKRPTTSSRATATCLIFRAWQRFSPLRVIRLPAASTVSFPSATSRAAR